MGAAPPRKAAAAKNGWPQKGEERSNVCLRCSNRLEVSQVKVCKQGRNRDGCPCDPVFAFRSKGRCDHIDRHIARLSCILQTQMQV